MGVCFQKTRRMLRGCAFRSGVMMLIVGGWGGGGGGIASRTRQRAAGVTVVGVGLTTLALVHINFISAYACSMCRGRCGGSWW